MKRMGQDIEDFYTVVSITENKDLARKLINFFLIDYSEEEQKEILTELENRDSRFIGWSADFMQEYTYKNISGDALNLGRGVARKAIDEKRKIRVLFY